MIKDPSVKSAPVGPSTGKPTAGKTTAAKPAAARTVPMSPETKGAGSTVVAKTAPPRSSARTAAAKLADGRPLDDVERLIQQRAYELWENEGRPQGREQEHWQQAEREIAGRRAGSRA